MIAPIDLAKLCHRKIVMFTSTVTILALPLVFTAATADSPSDAKKVAFEVVERNATQIATVGDVLYYFAEPGMQEYESAKYLKRRWRGWL